jgi:hypothetical protein
LKDSKVEENILKGYTKKEIEALNEYYRKKFSVLTGRSTSSKSVGIVSDMHVGSIYALYSGYAGYNISPDQKKLRDWWLDCSDKMGRVTVLLLNGEPTNGPNNKQNGYENWSSSVNEQLQDAERLIGQMKHEDLVMTKGSAYHTQQGWTNDEETMAHNLGATPYQGMFAKALTIHSDKKGMALVQEHEQKTNKISGQHTDYYIFFDMHGRLFNATHHVGFNRWFAYRTTALAREMADMEFARGKYYGFNQDIDVLIRSHVHYFVHVEYGSTHGFTTPAWKFPDMHLFKGGLGGTYPHIGAVEVIVEQNGDMEINKHLASAKQLPHPNILHF